MEQSTFRLVAEVEKTGGEVAVTFLTVINDEASVEAGVLSFNESTDWPLFADLLAAADGNDQIEVVQ